MPRRPNSKRVLPRFILMIFWEYVGCVLTNTICRQLLQVVESAYSPHVCNLITKAKTQSQQELMLLLCKKGIMDVFVCQKPYFFGQTTYFGHCSLQLLKYWQSQTKGLNCTTTWLDALFNDDFFYLNKEFPSVTCTASVRD